MFHFSGISIPLYNLLIFLSYLSIFLKEESKQLCLFSSSQTHKKGMFHINLIFLLPQQPQQMFFLKMPNDLLYYFSLSFFPLVLIPKLSSSILPSISSQSPLLVDITTLTMPSHEVEFTTQQCNNFFFLLFFTKLCILSNNVTFIILNLFKLPKLP